MVLRVLLHSVLVAHGVASDCVGVSLMFYSVLAMRDRAVVLAIDSGEYQHRGAGMGVAVAAFWTSSVITNQCLWSIVQATSPSTALAIVCALGVLPLLFVALVVR